MDGAGSTEVRVMVEVAEPPLLVAVTV